MNLTKQHYTLLFLLCFFLISFSVNARETVVPERIKYSISPKMVNNEQHLEIRLTFKAKAKNSTFLILPYQMGGQTNLHQQIKDLKCTNYDFKVQATDEPAIKRILHTPNTIIEVTYLVQSGKSEETAEFKPNLLSFKRSDSGSFPLGVCDNEAAISMSNIAASLSRTPREKITSNIPHLKGSELGFEDWYHRPIIDNDYFLVFGQGLFIIPLTDVNTNVAPDFEKPVHITLDWKDCPQQWTIANSFGAQERRQKLHLSIPTLFEAVYTGGDFKLISCGEPSAPIYIAIRDPWTFIIDRLSQLLQTIIQGQRKFWNDEKFPYYLVTVLSSENSRYISGTALNNSFAIFIGDFEDKSEQNWKALTYLLGHEHFHTWNGLKMAPSEPEKMQWFMEGFTDFYAIELNYRMHLFSLDDYLDYVNVNLYDFYANPERNARNRKIASKFWTDFNFLRLPYVRGFSLAWHWNKQIQKQSKNASSLDDLMHDLFKKVQKSGTTYSLNDLQRIVGKYLGKETAAYDIQHYVIKGETIPIDEQSLEGSAVVEWIEDVGFNVKLSKLHQIVVGVFEGNEAYQAGLRNGQRFVSYTATQGSVTVTISEEGAGKRTIHYTLEGPTEFIPQFTSVQSLGAIAA